MRTHPLTYWLLLALLCSAKLAVAESLQIELSESSFTEDNFMGEISADTQRFFIPALIYQLFIKADPHKNQKAHVRILGNAPKISNEETTYLKERDKKCNLEISFLLGRPVALEHTPRIVFLGSGGGMRASLFTAGSLKNFAETGIINTFQYTGGVSGSTWTIVPWQISGKPFEQFYPIHINRVVNGIIPKTFNQGAANILCFTDVIAETILRSLAFYDIPSSVDIFGLFLGLGLLGDGTKVSYATTNLTSIVPFIDKGQQPLPLCTAVIPSTKDVLLLDVIECTPFDVTDYSSNTSVPAWGCGRTYKNGVSTNTHPPLNLGFMMGVFGSSFTAVTLKDLWPSILAKLWPKELFAPLGDLFTETKIGDLRVFPAHIRNFAYGIQGAVHQSDLFNLWVDAGISTNIPIVPFFKQPDRAADIYVICDAGGDVSGSLVLSESETYARLFNYPFPHCNNSAACISTLSVFDDGPQSNAPIVIYMPMIKNSRYNDQFDPQDMMYNNRPGNFLSTDNFVFTQTQVDLLAGLSYFSAAEAKQTIVESIKKIVERKEQGLRPSITYNA